MSNRVIGSSLKPALQVAAAKQVAASGLHVVSSQVTFTGKTAYAVWDEQFAGGQRGNRAFRINYPALADDATLSRVEADLISAYTLHETGHVLYTCNANRDIEILCGRAGVSRSIAHPISNGLEDGRMENSVIAAGIARNAKYLFGRLLNKMTAEMSNWNPCDFVHAAFACALLSRQAYGNGNSTTANLLARIPEPKRSLYAWVMEQCLLAPVGYDNKLWAYNTAIEFVLRWRAIESSKPKPPEPEEEGEEGEEEDGVDGEPGEEVIGNPGAPSGENDGDPEEDEDLDLDGDDHDDSLEDREFDDGEEAEDEPDEGDGEGGGGSNDPFEPEDGEEEESDGGKAGGGDEEEEDDGEPVAPGESNAGGTETFDFNDAGSSGDTPKSAEPSIDEIFKRANKRAEGSAAGALKPIILADCEDPMDFIKERLPGAPNALYNDRPYEPFKC